MVDESRRKSAPATGHDAGRHKGLDGLRGVAAVLVVVHHGAQVTPTGDRLMRDGLQYESWTAAWWFGYTPLRLVWVGEEAVLIFFVLSGLVLALPALRPGFSWSAYYPQRLVRLYLPVVASLVVASSLALLPRVDVGATAYLTSRASASPASAPLDALLVFGVSLLNSPLWSLRWEVIFSLLLPVYVQAAIRCRRQPLLVGGALVMVIGAGTVLGSPALRFLPVFGLGVLVAVHRRWVADAADSLSRWGHSRPVTVVLVLVLCVLLTARWTGLLFGDGIAVSAVTSAATLAGAVLAVVLSMSWRPIISVLSSDVAQWLGRCSFSLYVVHEPVIVTTAAAIGPDAPPWLMFSLAVALAIPAGQVFYLVVERPSHRLARAVGASARRAGARRGLPEDVR